MIRIALVGDIGSGKSFISKLFGYPVFNADEAVAKIYSKDKKIYYKLKKKIPNTFFNFPVEKESLINAIIRNKKKHKKNFVYCPPRSKKKIKSFLKKK